MANRPHRQVARHCVLAAGPPYNGHNQKLARLIFAAIVVELPTAEWAGRSFLDPCSGSGAIARYAKLVRFDITASDIAERACIASRALVANDGVRLRRADVLRTMDAGSQHSPGPLATLEPPLLTERRAHWLDRLLAGAAEREEPVSNQLQLLWLRLTLKSFPVSMPSASEAAAAAAEEFDRISPRRLSHYLKAAQAPALDELMRQVAAINAGVTPRSGVVLRRDARDVIPSVAPEVCYLDSLYAGTTRYEHAYAVVDAALGDTPAASTPPSVDELLDAACDVPLIVLSYGGPIQTLDTLRERVAAHRPVPRALAVHYPHLASVPGQQRKEADRELLIVC